MKTTTTTLTIIALTTSFVAALSWQQQTRHGATAESDATTHAVSHTAASRSVASDGSSSIAHAEELAALTAQLAALALRVDALGQRADTGPMAGSEAAPRSDPQADRERAIDRVVAGLAREAADTERLAAIESLREAAPSDAFGSAQLVDSHCSTHYCRIEYLHEEIDRQVLVDNLPLFLPDGAQAQWSHEPDGRTTVAYVTLLDESARGRGAGR